MQTNVIANNKNITLFTPKSSNGFKLVRKNFNKHNQREPKTPTFIKKSFTKDVECTTDCSSMKSSPIRQVSPITRITSAQTTPHKTSDCITEGQKLLSSNKKVSIFCSARKLYQNSKIPVNKPKRNRKKEKSLQILTQRFLRLYSNKPEGYLTLQDVINNLRVEKRRIYDVVNILEAFKVIFRKEKNCYLWCGLNSIQDTIAKFENGQNVTTSQNVSSKCHGKGNKKKMLTSLSAKFVKFFLKSSKAVTLEEAAKEFCAPHASKKLIKTKIRRLYDISNVFQALGIIEKTFISCRKPAFIWKGLQGFLKAKTEFLTDNTPQSISQDQKEMKIQKKTNFTFETTLRKMFNGLTDDTIKVNEFSNQIPLFQYRDLTTASYSQNVFTQGQIQNVQVINCHSLPNIQFLQILQDQIKQEQAQRIYKKSVLGRRRRGKASFDDISDMENRIIIQKQPLEFVHKRVKRQNSQIQQR